MKTEVADINDSDPEIKSIDLQGDFLSMSIEDRQEFISWAVKHLHD